MTILAKCVGQIQMVVHVADSVLVVASDCGVIKFSTK